MTFLDFLDDKKSFVGTVLNEGKEFQTNLKSRKLSGAIFIQHSLELSERFGEKLR